MTEIAPALERLNESFHERYDSACGSAEHAAPVFVLFADSLVVFHHGKKHEIAVTKPRFHAIKSAAHAPIAVYAALMDHRGGPIDAQTRKRLEAIRAHAVEAGSEHEDEVDHAVDAVLGASIEFIDHRLADREHPTLHAFAAESGPLLRKLTEHATKLQLASLHQAVEGALASLTDGDRRALQVVVAGDHQARVRSLGMQYFQKRFGERAGSETHVTYAESIQDPEQALALVGKRRVDRAIAKSFFGDEKHLQRDVLGDAAAALLHDTTLDAI